MNSCTRKGCGSFALNDHPGSVLCDVCWWRAEAERLRGRPTLDEVAQVIGNLLSAHKVNPKQRRIETAHAVRRYLRERFPHWVTPNPELSRVAAKETKHDD